MHVSWGARDPAASRGWCIPAAGCVVDVSLSLRRCGLFWTLSLAETMPVWLPQGHWTLVEDGTYARDERVTGRLGGAPGVAGAVAFRCATQEWSAARAGLRLEGRPNVFWTGDSWAESVIPKEDDAGLLDRRDALAAALDARLMPVEPSPMAVGDDGVELYRGYIAPDILADCARDALALAAALQTPRTIILTAMEQDEVRPGLTGWLDRAGVCCKRLEEGPVREALRWQLAPALLRSGLAVPIEAGQLRVAGLLLVAPRVTAAVLDDSLDWGAASASEVRQFWDDASAIWWEVP
jgi:hypothetical protein